MIEHRWTGTGKASSVGQDRTRNPAAPPFESGRFHQDRERTMAKNGKHFRALEEAKAAGYKVEIHHFREPYAYTFVALYRPGEDVPVAEGDARCSTKDNFNRRLGVQIACGRALKAAQGR